MCDLLSEVIPIVKGSTYQQRPWWANRGFSPATYRTATPPPIMANEIGFFIEAEREIEEELR
jgi:hypothetical protein